MEPCESALRATDDIVKSAAQTAVEVVSIWYEFAWCHGVSFLIFNGHYEA